MLTKMKGYSLLVIEMTLEMNSPVIEALKKHNY